MAARRSRCSRSRPRRRFCCSRAIPPTWLLLEVGLGGRLDATNVIETPLACVITPVSMDHLEFLGDTLEKIAAEKAAILKRERAGRRRARNRREALAVIERRRRRVRAPLHAAGRALEHVSIEHGRLVYQDDDGLLDLPAPKLAGRHQFDNAGTADRDAARREPFKLPPAAFEARHRQGRMAGADAASDAGQAQALAPPDSELWLDGGHNADGGRAVAAALGDLEERVPRPLVLIVGMLATKDSAGFLTNFAGLARRVIAVPIPRQEKSVPPDALRRRARARHSGARASRHVEAALRGRSARLELDLPPRILITGSLYLAGRSAGHERHAAADLASASTVLISKRPAISPAVAKSSKLSAIRPRP